MHEIEWLVPEMDMTSFNQELMGGGCINLDGLDLEYGQMEV